MPAPTIRQIAAACGVNASTVSRALNNHPGIPASTRERISAMARRMGWRPNPLASAYMSHFRSTQPSAYKATLAFVTDHPLTHGPAGLPGHVTRHLRGAQRRAALYGYGVTAFSLADSEMTPSRLDRVLHSQNIPGAIFSAFGRPDTSLEGFDWSRYSVAAIGRTVPDPVLHCVDYDMHRGFRKILRQAFALGYHDVGVVVSDAYDDQVSHGVLEPFYYFSHALPAGNSLELLPIDDNAELEVGRIASWIEQRRPQLVTGIWVADAIEHLGWRVPEDIALISVDRDPFYSEHAGIDQRHDLIGEHAAEVVIAQLNHNQRGIPNHPVRHMIEGRWIDGASAPPRGGKRSSGSARRRN